jgi:broad specificity phosphatase PhoE
MIRLALLRHGHTAWNRSGRIQGRTDVPLDEPARAHLGALSLPASWKDAEIVASPLSRAMDTASLVTGQSPRPIPALIEMDWGRWEGAYGAVLKADPGSGFRDIENWGWSFCPPGGESPDEMRLRLRPWVDALRRDTVAVCHIGVMRVIMAIATGWDFKGSAPFQIKRNRLYVLHIDDEGWHVVPSPERLSTSLPCE